MESSFCIPEWVKDKISDALQCEIKNIFCDHEGKNNCYCSTDDDSGIFFLWLWRYGIKDYPNLCNFYAEIKNILSQMAKTQFSSNAVPGYTKLVNAIWISRPDLHYMPCHNKLGQSMMVSWLYKHGIDEYYLRDILYDEAQKGYAPIPPDIDSIGDGFYLVPINICDTPDYDQQMGPNDHAFIKYLLDYYKPKRIIEIGVAAGGTSAFILKNTSNNQFLYGVDIDNFCYSNKKKPVGYIVDEVCNDKEKQRYKLLLGKDVIEQLDEIDDGIDFCILDTVHHLPGEVLSFLGIYKKLRPGACVLVHDLSLNFYSYPGKKISKNSFCTRLLFCVVGSNIKYLPATELHTMGAFIKDNETERSIPSILMALGVTWHYYPKELITKYSRFIEENYKTGFANIFNNIAYQQSIITKM